MYEITIIENLSQTAQIFHTAVDDEHVDQVVEELHDNEMIAVRNGQIKCFTVLAEYQRYNNVHHYRKPESLVAWK